MSIIDLPVHAKVVLVGLGTWRQSRVDGVARVGPIPQRSFLTYKRKGRRQLPVVRDTDC